MVLRNSPRNLRLPLLHTHIKIHEGSRHYVGASLLPFCYLQTPLNHSPEVTRAVL